MKKFIPILLGLTLVLGNFACRNYVEVPPVQSRVLRYTSDYLALMTNTSKFDNAYYSPVFSGDEIGSSDIRWQNSLSVAFGNAYIWAPNIYESGVEDLDWGGAYARILICNTVLSGVDKSENGTEQQKQLAKSYALVHRAYDYLTLVNMYAKPYNPATASTDPGVPIVLKPDFFASLPRATVAATYTQIIKDLNEALPGLSDLPDFNPNPSRVAVYSILARVYLNTRDFVEADKYAGLALQLKNKLLDLNAYIANPKTIPARQDNSEEIFFKKTNNMPVTYPLSEDAINTFDKKDLRYVLFTADGATIGGSNFTTRAYWRYKIISDGNYVGPSVPEMMLIRAECAARKNGNSPAVATDILNTLRVKRFKPTEYTPLTAANNNQALQFVIDERKRELVGRGFRWFDQRRLSQDPGVVPAVTRVFKGVTYTLQPGGNSYVYPIAEKYILANPEIEQNPF